MILIRRAQPVGGLRRFAADPPMFVAVASAARGRRGTWQPAMEMYETPDNLTVVAEIAGMSGEDVDIVIEGDVLTIQGDRIDHERCEGRSYHVANVGYGPFAVNMRLPFAVDSDEAQASYDNGFLKITLPRLQKRNIVPTRTPENEKAGNA